MNHFFDNFLIFPKLDISGSECKLNNKTVCVSIFVKKSFFSCSLFTLTQIFSKLEKYKSKALLKFHSVSIIFHSFTHRVINSIRSGDSAFGLMFFQV